MKALPVFLAIISILIGIALLVSGSEAYAWIDLGDALEGWVRAVAILIALSLIAGGVTWLWKQTGFKGLNSK